MSCKIEPNSNRGWKDKSMLGMLLMLCSLALYPLSDAFVKHLIGTYSVPQTSFLRAAARLIPLAMAVPFLGGFKQVFTLSQPKIHCIRLGINLLQTYAFMYAFSVGSLTAVYTFGYSSSFFSIVLGALFLKEVISREKWLAVSIGLFGILIAIRPGSDLFNAVAIAALLGTFLGALQKIFLRKLTKTEHSLAMTIFPNIIMIGITLPFLLPVWQSMPWKDWGLFGIIGLLTALAQYMLTQALRYTQISSLAALDYSNFLWILSLDLLWWQLSPDIYTVIGAIIIILSNLYILHCTKKEERKKKEPLFTELESTE